MNKKYFWDEVIMAVEIEEEDGHRFWKTMKNEKVQSFINGLSAGRYLSDIDFCTKQENSEIAEIMKRAEDIFWGRRDHGFKSFNDAIDSLLEEDKPKRIWTEDEIRGIILNNDKGLYKALLVLYNQQTADEQADGNCKHFNGAGFNGVDAPILTSFSQFLQRTGFLTPKQRVIARKKLIKYVRQLTRLANIPA